MDLIFLTGHRKSGTTLLHNLFDGHKDACIYPVDLSIFYAYFPGYAQDKSLTTKDLTERLRTITKTNLSDVFQESTELNFESFWEAFCDQIDDDQLRSKKPVLTALLTAWKQEIGDNSDRPIIIKETTQSIYIHEILQGFPTCKFIHIVRDPRDNYSALKSGVEKYYSKLGEDNLKTIASLINRVKLDFQSARNNLKNYKDCFTTIRFEDLVTNPKPEMERLAKFCNIEFDQSMLQPTRFGVDFSGNSYEQKKFTGISPDNISRWNERIDENEAQIIEYWLGDLMLHFGYERAFSENCSQMAFSKFYDWYNSEYFQSDPYKIR